MSKEDSTRTPAEPADKPALRSKDQEPEIQEDFEIDQPEEKQRDIEDIIAEDDDPRSAIYAKGSRQREADIAKGNAYIGGENAESGEQNPESGVENPETPDIIEGQGNSEPSATPPDVEDTVAVVINGERRLVAKTKVDAQGGVENYQIRIAAQEQMERNAHERKQNEQERQKLEQRQAALDERERRLAATDAEIPATDSQQGAQNPDDLPASDGQDLNDMAAKVLDAVYDGDENAPSNLVATVKTIVKEVVGNNQNQPDPVSPEELTQQVTEQVLQNQRYAKVVSAREALFSSTPELDEDNPRFDPRLFQAVDDETDVVAKQHPDWEPEKIINTAWDRIKEWKGEHKTDSMTDKQEAKREMNRPRQAGGRYTPPPPPPRKTDSDYVKSLREERGLE